MAKVASTNRPRRTSRGTATARAGRSGQASPPATGALVPPALRESLPRLHADLLRWFARVGRDLPWRRRPEAYRTWVSETMLQQTQVDRVVDYFTRFLARFPTVEALAAAPEADVLRLWEGLGYYRRARQLHAAARRIVADHGGRLPDAEAPLRALPGIGRYTAAAILSIAFGRPFPVVEANSRRVLARLAGYGATLSGTSADGPVWEIAAALLPPDSPGDWNQALMDLGAIVCTPRAPACPRCPVASCCQALATGRVASIPAMAAKRATEERSETALVLWRGTKVLVVRRGPGEWWEGLWDFPRAEDSAGLEALRPGRPKKAGVVTYSVTHHRVRVEVAVAEAAAAGGRRAGRRWIEWSRLGSLAMTAPGRRIAALASRSGGPGGVGDGRRRRPPSGR